MGTVLKHDQLLYLVGSVRKASMITSARNLLILGLLVLLIFKPSKASAEMLTIRLVHGKSGKPVTNKNVTVTFWWEDPESPNKDKWTPMGSLFGGTELYIDKTGAGHIEIPAKAAKVEVRAGPKIGSDPFRIPYEVCNEHLPGLLSIKQVLIEGFVDGDQCNKKLSVKPQPGVIVFFAIPLPWYNKILDFQ